MPAYYNANDRRVATGTGNADTRTNINFGRRRG